RFDADRLEMTGPPVLLWRGLGLGAFGVVDFALASTGSLLYSTDYNTTIAQPTWVTRDGAATPIDAAWPAGLVYSVAISPDGSQLAAEFHQQPVEHQQSRHLDQAPQRGSAHQTDVRGNEQSAAEMVRGRARHLVHLRPERIARALP